MTKKPMAGREMEAGSSKERLWDSRVEWFLASRLLSFRRGSYVSLVSSISMWGLAFGVASLVVIFSVTSGFEEVFLEKVLGLYPHMVVIGRGGDLPDWQEVLKRLENTEDVVSATAATYDEMMASRGTRRSGCIVKGVDSQNPSVADVVSPFLLEGSVGELSVEPRFSLSPSTPRLRSGQAIDPSTSLGAGHRPLDFARGRPSTPRLRSGQAIDHPTSPRLRRAGRPSSILSCAPAKLPGGSAYAVAVLANGEVRTFANYEEDADIARVRVASTLGRPVSVQFEGLLTDVDVEVAGNAVTEYEDVVPGPLSVSVDGQKTDLDVQRGSHTLLVGEVEDTVVGAQGSEGASPRRGSRTVVLDCPLPQPGPASAPATVCVASFGGAVEVPGSWQQMRLQPPYPGLPHEGGGDVPDAVPHAWLRSGQAEGGGEAAGGTVAVFEERDVALPRVILGKELAQRIEAGPGDEVRLVSPLMAVPGAGSSGRPERTIADTFEVEGIVSLGFYEYDSKLAMVDFAAARRLLHSGDSARWVELRVEDIFRMPAHVDAVGRALSGFSLLDVAEAFPKLDDKLRLATAGQPPSVSAGDVLTNVTEVISQIKFSNVDGEMAMGYDRPYRIISWEEMNEPLFGSMKRQRIVLSLFFLIMIVVAAFNVVSSQMMIVREKGSDIAIIKAMGGSDKQVKRVFLIQGMSIGLLGTAAGLLLALGACLLLMVVGFPLDPKVYFVSKLPVHLRVQDLAMAATVALASTYAAVSVAARRAARKDPVEGLREVE